MLVPSFSRSYPSLSIFSSRSDIQGRGERTRRKGSLELLSLLGVLENKGVQVLLAPDLELDLLGGLVLLDPGGCRLKATLLEFRSVFAMVFLGQALSQTYRKRPCAGRSR